MVGSPMGARSTLDLKGSRSAHGATTSSMIGTLNLKRQGGRHACHLDDQDDRAHVTITGDRSQPGR
jgi:hypothetical protein